MLNNSSLVGRLTKDPEVRTLNGGEIVASFTLAVQRNKDKTDFIPCEAWGKTAESVRDYVTKGSMVALQGRIQVDNFEVDGNKRSFTKVVADRVHFIELKKDASGESDRPELTDAELAGNR